MVLCECCSKHRQRFSGTRVMTKFYLCWFAWGSCSQTRLLPFVCSRFSSDVPKIRCGHALVSVVFDYWPAWVVNCGSVRADGTYRWCVNASMLAQCVGTGLQKWKSEVLCECCSKHRQRFSGTRVMTKFYSCWFAWGCCSKIRLLTFVCSRFSSEAPKIRCGHALVLVVFDYWPAWVANCGSVLADGTYRWCVNASMLAQCVGTGLEKNTALW